MPSTDAILQMLTVAANRWWPLAVAWHFGLAVLLLAVWRGWRPGRETAGRLLVLPLLSVSGLAWLSGNPFNAVVFAVLAVWLWRASRLTRDAVAIGARPMLIVAALLLAFAWVYPHFLGPSSWIYLVAAPLGVIPCPTLAALIGLVLVFDMLGSRGWAFTLGIIGVAYGLIGAVRLGVVVDLVLLVGSLCLLVMAWTRDASHPALNAQRKVAA